MAFELPNGEVSRTIAEQVAVNTKDIDVLKTGYNQVQDVKISDGHLVVTLQDGTAIDAGAVLLMKSIAFNASRHLIVTYMDDSTTDLGEIKGLTSIAFNASRHLIVTYDDGSTYDAGLIKGVSSFSINGSQHLIVTYDDGTTQDLGAIFTGNISTSGTLTASGAVSGSEIIDTGFSPAFYADTYPNGTISPGYVGMTRIGKVIHMSVAFDITPTSSGTFKWFGHFAIPTAIGALLVPLLSNVLAIKKTVAWESVTNVTEGGIILIAKESNGQLSAQFNSTGLTNGTTYSIRESFEFLLSDNLAS